MQTLFFWVKRDGQAAIRHFDCKSNFDGSTPPLAFDGCFQFALFVVLGGADNSLWFPAPAVVCSPLRATGGASALPKPSISTRFSPGLTLPSNCPLVIVSVSGVLPGVKKWILPSASGLPSTDTEPLIVDGQWIAAAAAARRQEKAEEKEWPRYARRREDIEVPSQMKELIWEKPIPLI